jgi:signal recognition particle subunit SRP54
MTKKERRNPKIFSKEPSRKLRVIKGSGRSSDEFNKLMSEHKKAKEKIDAISKNLKSGKNIFSGFH